MLNFTPHTFIICLLFFSFSFSQISEAIIIDNTDSGFTVVNFWNTSTVGSGYYGTNYRKTNGGSGSKKATWTFQISTPGKYEVSAQWAASSDRALNAPYTIKNNGVTLQTVLVDQRVNGGQFNILGTYTLNAGTLEVVLTNNTSGSVAADAVQVVLIPNQAPNGVIDTPTGNVTINVGDTVSFSGTGSDPDGNLPLSFQWDFGDPAITDSNQEDPGVVQFNNSGTFTVTFTVTDNLGLPDPTPDTRTIMVNTVNQAPITVIIDNTNLGFTVVGSWNTSTVGSGYYGTNYRKTNGGSGSKKATWTFHVGTGDYEISAQWVQSSDRAPNAPYTIKNNGVTLQTVLVDQRVNGGQFNILGTYTLNAGTLEVVLTNNTSGSVAADAVRISTSQGVIIVSPSHRDLKASQDVLIKALAVGFPPNGGVGFILKEKVSGNIVGQVQDYSDPFEQLFTNLSLEEYTVDARMIDGNGTFQSPFSDNIDFGVGDYYVGFGDSITQGSKDNITSDNVSADGRNSGGGYEPILNNLLTTNQGYPHTVKNEGVGGNKSIDGVNRISAVLSSHPESQYLLILFGTNDASSLPPVPSGAGLGPGDSGYAGSFKDNMQQIITATTGAGRIPLLAKVPILYAPCGSNQPFPDPNQAPQNILIREYNMAVVELIASNNIQLFPPELFTPPDFYSYFQAHPGEIADFCHPNGTGYQSMANLWLNALVP